MNEVQRKLSSYGDRTIGITSNSSSTTNGNDASLTLAPSRKRAKTMNKASSNNIPRFGVRHQNILEKQLKSRKLNNQQASSFTVGDSQVVRIDNDDNECEVEQEEEEEDREEQEAVIEKVVRVDDKELETTTTRGRTVKRNPKYEACVGHHNQRVKRKKK